MNHLKSFKSFNENVDVIPAHGYPSDKKYKEMIQKYGSGIMNSGTNLVIEDESIDDQIYRDIQNMLRPSDNSLPMSEITDLTNTYDVDEEKVAWILQKCLDDRMDSNKNELKEAVSDCLKYLKEDENIEEPDFNTFLEWFNTSWLMDLEIEYTNKQIKDEFYNQIKDPNQMKLSLESVKKRCDSCEIMNVNGVRTHELGCPESYKDEKRKCKWCGSKFTPEESHQKFCCDGCAEDYNS